MKKLFLLLTLVVLTISIIGCARESAELYLLQNKPEIDSQLQEFAALFAEETGHAIRVVSCGGDSCAAGDQLRADIAAGETPDIFPIDGLAAYEDYKDIVYDLSNEPWVSDTDVAFTVDGKVYGFPVAVEGWGLAYNKDLINEANQILSASDQIDVNALTNLSEYARAFAALDSIKDELGINAVVSMAGGAAGMGWVTAHHNFNSLLSAGLQYGDLSITNELLAGQVDGTRLSEYVDWVDLLFQYADQTILTTGDYNANVNAFAEQKVVFIHQGNWIEPNLIDAGATFERAYAPHGPFNSNTDGIFVSAPSWYVVNKDSDNLEGALEFLRFMATTETGHDYLVNKINAIPAFKSVTLEPSAPLSVSVANWVAQGKIYSWNQYYFTESFRDDTLAPIYAAYANDDIDKATFVSQLQGAFEGLKN